MATGYPAHCLHRFTRRILLPVLAFIPVFLATDLHAAHVAMQLAAFALSAGQADIAIDIVDRNIRPVAQAENAALLSTLLMVKAEALKLKGQTAQARGVREDALGWARYGFGSDAEVRARFTEISALAPQRMPGT